MSYSGMISKIISKVLGSVFDSIEPEIETGLGSFLSPAGTPSACGRWPARTAPRRSLRRAHAPGEGCERSVKIK